MCSTLPKTHDHRAGSSFPDLVVLFDRLAQERRSTSCAEYICRWMARWQRSSEVECHPPRFQDQAVGVYLWDTEVTRSTGVTTLSSLRITQSNPFGRCRELVIGTFDEGSENPRGSGRPRHHPCSVPHSSTSLESLEYFS